MNVNGVTPNSTIFSQRPSALSQREVIRQPAAGQAATEPTVQKSTERPFYEYQDEPWLTEPGIEVVAAVGGFVKWAKIEELLDFALMHSVYDSFMRRLGDAHPEIAGKKFGFTLGADTSIKIVGCDDRMTENEKSVLTDAINNHTGFKFQLHLVARGYMTLVDHDRETFGGRYRLDIDNFNRVIDFSKILGAGQAGMHDEWVRQVIANAEQRDSSSILLTV